MKDEQIIKALECCGKNPPVCSGCDYKGRCNRIDCYDYLKRDALDLINRQKAEIERLKEKTRNVFTGVINKFLGLEDLYVIVEGDFVPWEPTEEVEHLFEISLSGEDEELVNDIDKAIKELVGEAE